MAAFIKKYRKSYAVEHNLCCVADCTAHILEVAVAFIVLDGAGAATLIFRDNISVPIIPASARAR
jgi:hypothetical protein